jgi:hypothetical protein
MYYFFESVFKSLLTHSRVKQIIKHPYAQTKDNFINYIYLLVLTMSLTKKLAVFTTEFASSVALGAYAGYTGDNSPVVMVGMLGAPLGSGIIAGYVCPTYEKTKGDDPMGLKLLIDGGANAISTLGYGAAGVGVSTIGLGIGYAAGYVVRKY